MSRTITGPRFMLMSLFTLAAIALYLLLPSSIATADTPTVPPRQQLPSASSNGLSDVLPERVGPEELAPPEGTERDGSADPSQRWLSITWEDELPSEPVAGDLMLEASFQTPGDDENPPALGGGDMRKPDFVTGAGNSLVWSGEVGDATRITWLLRLDKYAIAWGQRDLDEGNNDLRLRLSDLPSLALDTVDARSGTPVSATAECFLRFGSELYKFTGTSAKDGRARLAPLPAQCIFSAKLESPGFVSALTGDMFFSTQCRSLTQRVKMQPSFSMAGRVVSPDGNPQAACDVTVRSSGADAHAKTDSEGNFHVSQLPAGSTQIVATSPTFADACCQLESSNDGASVTLTLGKACYVDGLVATSQGAPLLGEPIHARAREHFPGDSQHSRRMALSAADGRFRVGPFAPGDQVDLIAIKSGAGAVAASGTTCEIKVPVQRLAQIQVELADKMTGELLDGVANVAMKNGSVSSTSSDAKIRSGRVMVRGMVDDALPTTIAVSKAGYMPAEVDCPSGALDSVLKVTLESAASMLVECRNDQGAPVPNAAVTLEWRARASLFAARPQNVMTVSGVGTQGGPLSILSLVATDTGEIALSAEFPRETRYSATAAGHYPAVGSLYDQRGVPGQIIFVEIDSAPIH